MVLLLGVVFSYVLWHRGQRLRPGVDGLVRRTDGAWELVGPAGATPAVLLEGCVATRFLLILRFRTGSRRRQVLICRDATDPESFRRLLVFLRTRSFSASADRP